jgi:hypothetical protein
MKNWYKKSQNSIDREGNPLSNDEEASIRTKYELFDPSKKIHPDRIDQYRGEQGLLSRSSDFTSVDVRRLSGILEDHQSLSKDALAEMDKWLSNGEYSITIEEAQKRLSYYLARMGIE